MLEVRLKQLVGVRESVAGKTWEAGKRRCVLSEGIMNFETFVVL